MDMQLADYWNKHHNCELVIYWKRFNDGQVVAGLYCKHYGNWIQWLDIQTADELILEGVEVVLEQPKKLKGHPRHKLTVSEAVL